MWIELFIPHPDSHNAKQLKAVAVKTMTLMTWQAQPCNQPWRAQHVFLH